MTNIKFRQIFDMKQERVRKVIVGCVYVSESERESDRDKGSVEEKELESFWKLIFMFLRGIFN